jgi:DNA polymerase I-like protein with 3'-5' exonuclease and polymerase domains
VPYIFTDEIDPSVLFPHDALQIYNGLDCCITSEIAQEIIHKRAAPMPAAYGFSLALQAPAMEMMLRGWKIDPWARQEGTQLLLGQLDKLNQTLQAFAFAVWDKPLNPRSPLQVKDFLYGALKLPEHWISQKGVKKLSTNRETLEKLEVYFHARPIVATILAYRDVAKQLETLQKEIDSDGRWRTSYNIGGTETGRWSSSTSAEGTGSNTQNINPALRDMFVADEGFVLVGIDLEQTESRDVGWICGTLFNDWTYLDACEAGDLHTTVCRLVWTKLPWTGDKKKDREIADQPFYRHFSYRDMAKRGGHGTNYLGTAFTMARHLKVPPKIIEDFQKAYFSAFPCIPRWHQWTAQQIQTVGKLITPMGRERTFFGRPNDDTTLRAAIAHVPQSTTADRLNLGLWRVWKKLGLKLQLLGQVHDAIYFQVPEEANIPEIIQEVLALLETPLFHKGRRFVVPGEAKWGWNWGNHHLHTEACLSKGCLLKENPDGLGKWKGKIDRKRTAFLDRRF